MKRDFGSKDSGESCDRISDTRKLCVAFDPVTDIALLYYFVYVFA